MKTFKEMCDNKMSVAVRAMCDGLESQSKRKNFIVDMHYYGLSRGKICYGCAATCAAQKIAGVNLTAVTIDESKDRAKKLGVDQLDLDMFEFAIDSFRQGKTGRLKRYFDLPWGDVEVPDQRWNLEDDDWREQLPEVLDYAAELEEAGL